MIQSKNIEGLEWDGLIYKMIRNLKKKNCLGYDLEDLMQYGRLQVWEAKKNFKVDNPTQCSERTFIFRHLYFRFGNLFAKSLCERSTLTKVETMKRFKNHENLSSHMASFIPLENRSSESFFMSIDSYEKVEIELDLQSCMKILQKSRKYRQYLSEFDKNSNIIMSLSQQSTIPLAQRNELEEAIKACDRITNVICKLMSERKNHGSKTNHKIEHRASL